MQGLRRAFRPVLVAFALAALTLAVFWPVHRHEFVRFDDTLYVTENPTVRAGLTPEGFRWAFTATHSSNWHPLTWLSHMLDVELFGLDPGAHHMVNVSFHVLNTLLLFLVLRGMTGLMWRSAAVAALFAVHPLHVESVAWVAERKDVLSTLFWLLTMGAYLRYARRPRAGRYLPVLGCFALGLMTKPMLVTLPFLLLLLDWWPLGRLGGGAEGLKGASWGPPLLEKVPLAALVVGSSWATYLAQKHGGSVATVFPLAERISNALLSYVKYMAMMFWPRHLAALYPLPTEPLPWWQGAWSGALLLAFTFLVLRLVRRHPFLAVGWFWYLGTLVPVIGLVQVGQQTMADRYTYVPLTGLFIILVWGAGGLMGKGRSLGALSAAVFAALLVALSFQARTQVLTWRDSMTLFSRMLEVSPDSASAHYSMGSELEESNRLEEARQHYLAALKVNPYYSVAHNNLAIVYEKMGMRDSAIRHYRMSVQLDPRNATARYNLGVALLGTGEPEEAILHFGEALRIEPSYSEAGMMLEFARKRIRGRP